MTNDFEPGYQYDDYDIICPHCGFERAADFEDNNEDPSEHECEECGKKYLQWAVISISYCTMQKKKN
jgi:hypothetical protein